MILSAEPPEFMANYEQERAAVRIGLLHEVANAAGSRLLDACAEQQPLGSGAQKVVYEYGDDRVIAFFAPMPYAEFHDRPGYSIDYLKETYFGAKLAHALLPKHLPDVHMVGSQPPFMVIDRVIPKPPRRFTGVVRSVRDAIARTRLDRKLDKFGLGADTSAVNFIRDRSGKLMYVDSLHASYPRVNKIKKRLKRMDNPSRDKASHYLQRLIEDNVLFQTLDQE